MSTRTPLPDGQVLTLIDPDPSIFCTYDRQWLRAYQDGVVRWAPCAPAGARFLPAPLQGWDGTPCGGRQSMNLGAGRALRDARAARGLCPLSGVRLVPR